MSNDLAAVAEVAILAAVDALRNNAVTPRLVNSDLEGAPAEQNTTINVPVYNNMVTSDVTAGSAPATTNDVKPRSANVVLDQWKEVAFQLNDREMAEVMDGKLPKVLERAVKAIADTVDNYILGKMVKRAGASAVDVAAGASVANLVSLRRLMNEQAIPLNERRLIVSPLTEAELLTLDTFHSAEKVGDQGTALREGSLGRAFGFDIYMNQNLDDTYTPGTLSAGQLNGAQAMGTRLVAIDTVTGTLNEGDIINIAGSGVHVVLANYSGAAGNLSIGPGLRASLGDNAAITLLTGWAAGTTVRGLGFHADAFAFGSRPLKTDNVPGAIITMSTDPLTGLSLRLSAEYSRKMTSWSLDILYGGTVVEEERIALLFT